MKFIKNSFIFVLFTFLLWATGFGAYIAYSIALKPADMTVPADAVVVLTGGDKRVETGLELLANGHAKYLFISGVNPQVRENEIRLLWKGTPALPACCIVLGQNANTTFQNAAETGAWIRKKQFKTIRLVTANYHMPRALLELSNTMPGVKIMPHPVMQPDLQTWTKQYWVLLLSEYHKIIVRWLSLKTGLENV